MRLPSFASLTAFVLVSSLPLAGCSSSSSSSASSSSAATSGNPTCGLRLYPADYDESCQTALDQACCSQAQACADDASCVKLVDCMNACPTPRADACVNACAGGSDNPPGFAALDALASCSKSAPNAPPGATCSWPSGNGH